MTDIRTTGIKFGIVGVGEVAELRLLPALLTISEAILRGIVSRDPLRAQELCKKFGATTAYVSYETMLLDPDIDAIIIATPDKLHASMAIAAAEHGKHIFVEKPMATNPEDARAIVAAAKAHNVKLAVGYHLRHHAGHRLLKEALAQDTIGTLKHLGLTWSYAAPKEDWRATEALARWWAIAAVGTHAIDLATWFLDENGHPSIRVTRECDHGMLEHSAEIYLDWDSGKSATIIVSNRVTLPRLIDITGDRGTARCEDTLAAYGKGRISINGTELDFTPVDPYRAELHDFIESIRIDREPIVSGAAGLYNVDLLHQLN